MVKTEQLPQWYTKNSKRYICTPSHFAREHFLYVQEIGHVQRLSAGKERQRSSLNSYLFVAVCRGKGTLHYEGVRYPVKEGDCFWIDCRNAHSYKSDATDLWEIKWVHFNGQHADAYYQLFREQNTPTFCTGHFPALCSTLTQLVSDCTNDAQPLEALQACHITNLLTAAIKKETPDTSNKMQEVRVFLEEHFAEEITLDGLAAQFFLSKFYLARQFRAEYDCTIMEYLIQLRITRAKQLLRYSDDSIAQIAQACGYHDQSYFSRQFLKTEGIGARKYRQSWK